MRYLNKLFNKLKTHSNVTFFTLIWLKKKKVQQQAHKTNSPYSNFIQNFIWAITADFKSFSFVNNSNSYKTFSQLRATTGATTSTNNNLSTMGFIKILYFILNAWAKILPILIYYNFWTKLRSMYYVNNWIYTTNHKRIAVNYFWFVILSGIVGMVLATVIRLEFAYPGVGVFAGDSIQYLSLASAHGVIMVFFMIMPLLFGAFANFLLPTQLGVHDVAFPRLNSAAFWFLPGGLLMLCQLVCVDRRYQRMNCFNIREVQSLLKRKFFTDLINTNDTHLLLDKTAIGLRFKINNLQAVNSNFLISSNFGIQFNSIIRKNQFNTIINSISSDENLSLHNYTYFFIKKILNFNFFNFINTVLLTIEENALLNSNSVFLLSNRLARFHLSKHFELINNNALFSFYSYDNFFNALNSLLLMIFSKDSILNLLYKVISPFDHIYNFLLFLFTWIFNAFYFIYYYTSLFNIFNKFADGVFLKTYFMMEYLSYDSNSFYKLMSFFNEISIFLLSFIWTIFLLFQKFVLEVFEYFTKIRSHISILNWSDFWYQFLTDADFLTIEKNNFKNKYLYINTSIILNILWDCTNLLMFSYIELIRHSDQLFRYFYLNSAFNFNFFQIQGANTSEFLINKNVVSSTPYLEKPIDAFSIFYNPALIYLNYCNYNLNFSFISDSYDFYADFFSCVFYAFSCLPTLLFSLIVSFFKYFTLFAEFNMFANWFYTNVFYPFFDHNLLYEFHFILNYSFDFINLKLTDIFKTNFFFLNASNNQTLDTRIITGNWIVDNGTQLEDFFKPITFALKEFFLNIIEQLLIIMLMLFLGFYNIIVETLVIILFNVETSYIFFCFYNLIPIFFKFLNFFFFNSTATFNSKYFFLLNNDDKLLLTNEELVSSSRFKKFENPVFKYDYKAGDYFPKLNKELHPHLFSTILNLTSGLRTAPWLFSYNFDEHFNTTFENILSNKFFFFDNNSSVFIPQLLTTNPINKVFNTNIFYSFFLTMSGQYELNSQWISINTLNQKFTRMFTTSSMQQRVYSNWRQLKFTREAWRCKLLTARHQKTLFRRYLNEDGVFWSIERNAKDLIPGWAMITPFSSRVRFTAIGKTDIGLMGVLLVLNSSIISAANFLVTYRYLSTLNNRKTRDARAFFTEAVIVSSWMMILANPMLVIAIIMLLSDRHWQTSFFDYSGGGDTVLFQHMFWFFGHPEVYIIIIPTFGFTNTMISFYLRKRVSARASLLYSMYTIAFLGFFVWGHHMYMVGLAHTTRMLFSTLTVMISVPAATKIMHWCVTTVNSSFAMELPLLFTFTFIFFFVSGGISGMCVAHTGMDILFHDTFYVIAHFHVMLAGGAMFASFGAFYFYFPAIFGVKFSRIYAYLHYTYYLIGQLMTVVPMFWLGYAGMPRRVLDYPSSFGGWHSVISAGHMLNVAGLMAFFIMIFDSIRQGKAATRNTFGINRYNIRLNFYIYEIAKLNYVDQKALFLVKFYTARNVFLNKLSYINYEPFETVLLSYTFFKKNI